MTHYEFATDSSTFSGFVRRPFGSHEPWRECAVADVPDEFLEAQVKAERRRRGEDVDEDQALPAGVRDVRIRGNQSPPRGG